MIYGNFSNLRSAPHTLSQYLRTDASPVGRQLQSVDDPPREKLELTIQIAHAHADQRPDEPFPASGANPSNRVVRAAISITDDNVCVPRLDQKLRQGAQK